MDLSDLQLPLYVSTTDQDPIKVFFDPVFQNASYYDVAVGYFSSNWLRDAANGIAHFALNGGKARWIISPHLSESDMQLLSSVNDTSSNSIQELIHHSFESLYSELTQHTREALGWLIKDGILTFRIAIPRNILSGIMHAKQGLFSDQYGNCIAFVGSYNLTGGASTNWEAFSIFCSWSSMENENRIKDIRQSFERMWNGEDSNLAIYDPHSVDLQLFVQATENSSRHYDLFTNESISKPKAPDVLLTNGQLRNYQEDAIKNWFSKNGKGILQMATGTGKTVTALTAISRLCEYSEKHKAGLCTVISVPYQHLAEQWHSEACKFGFTPVLCYGGVSHWMEQAQRYLNDLQLQHRSQCMFITVNATMRDNAFQNLLANIQCNLLFVGDEMHNLGAKSSLEGLPENAGFRMGLSATPVRNNDDLGTQKLFHYFGDVVYEFGLDNAIREGYLCPYYYYPVLVYLTDEEQLEYETLSKQISRSITQEHDIKSPSNDYLKHLLIKRARLIGKAYNKLPNLIELLRQQSDKQHTLVYCGDSKEGSDRYIDRALNSIGNELGLRANKFTSGENAHDRKRLLSDFSNGDLDVLLAIRCLDEGVDVPMTQTAYIIASSANPKEFIQRRGRILRNAIGKTHATIYDFITVPNLDQLSDKNSISVERSLLRREINRFTEFAELAENYGDALAKMTEFKKRLHLLDY